MSSSHETQSSNAQIIEECESRFREEDAIMNPDVSHLLRRYLKAGGKPQSVVEQLSSSYRGYSQMTDLVISWMRMVGISEEQIEKTIISYLKNIIMKNFDTAKADAIFSASNDVPKWLDFMIENAEWRNLIYQLSEQHKNCLILNFAIQRISESGYHDEIASVTSASSSFRVFHRILTDAISKLILQNQETLQDSPQFADFKKICCHTQHTYIYAQCLLRALARSRSDNYYFLRLSEELESHAMQEQRGSEVLIRKIRFLFIEYDYRMLQTQQNGNTVSNGNASDITNALMSMLTANATNPSDVTKLYKLYSSTHPPPVEFLHHRDFFQLFIRDLFSPTVKINQSHKAKYVFLLSYAASLHPSQEQQDDVMQDDDQPQLPPLFYETQKAIQNATNICSSKTSPLNSTNTVAELRKYLQFNVVCMGVLHWITVIFSESEHSISVYSINNMKIYMALVKEIAYRHPEIRSSVLEIVKTCFAIKTELDPLQVVEIRRVYLDVLVYLIQTGYVLPTLNTLYKIISENLDLALVRHIASKIASMTEPPFSPEFVAGFSKILCQAKDAIKSTKDIRPFVEHVLSTPTYLLSSDERQTLTDIIS